MLYAYTRVSSKDQNLTRQIECLKTKFPHLDDKNIFSDKQSGKDFNRPKYIELKSILETGDEIVVKELDRFGRNKEAIKEELKYFKQKGILVRILDIPTTLIDYGEQVWVSEMITNILVEVLGSMAEQERIKIKSRQKEGIELAQAQGIKFGRPLKDTSSFEEYHNKVKDKEVSVQQAINEMKISKRTWYRLCKEVVI